MKSSNSRLIVGAMLSIACLANAAEVTDQSAQSAQSDSPIGRFDITRFEVDGNTLLPAETLRSLLAQYAGKSRDFAYVQRALEALEVAYHQRGYKLVRVLLPEQELNQGVVHLRVLETRIGAVKVHGNQFVDTANVRRSLPQLREGEVPALDDISASLRMANENPAKKVTLKLQNSTQDGVVDADVKVQDEKPWSIGVNLDNSGQSATGKHNIGVLFQHANIAGLDHVLSMQYQTTVEKSSRVGVYGLGYHIPLYTLGDSIDLFASYSDVDSGTITAGLVNLNVSGRGSVVGARYNQTLARQGDYESKLIYGLDYKAYKSDVQIPGIALQLGNDVTVRPLSLTYVANWTPGSSALNYYVSALQNIAGGDNGGKTDFNLARIGAPASYKMLRFGAGFIHGFASNWQVRATMNGQYSPDVLIPGEQFGAGGASSVRGYREREVSNDSGVYASAEVYTPNLCASASWKDAQCRILGFIDGASLRRNLPLPGEQARNTISSIGFGMRVALPKHFNLQMDFGQALASAGPTVKGDQRLHFKMNLAY